MLARGAQRLPGGGEHPQAGRGAQQGVRQLGAGVDQVLAAVQHQQGPAVGELLDQHVQRRAGGVVGQVQRLQHGVAEQQRVLHGGELGEVRAVREAVGQPGGGAQREAGLADAARAGHRDQPGPGQQGGQLVEFGGPADEAGDLGRQPARRRARHGRPRR
nr:hypothetical protein [Kitasatospora fiedleri]